MDAIVKVYFTECYDVIKRHSYVITIWRTSAIEVAALIKNLCSEMKCVQEKESIMGVRIEKSVPRDHSLASRGKPSSGRIFLTTPRFHDRPLYRVKS